MCLSRSSLQSRTRVCKDRNNEALFIDRGRSYTDMGIVEKRVCKHEASLALGMDEYRSSAQYG